MSTALEGRDQPAGYRMIESLEVQDFRAFEHVELRPLRRLNLIVGRNASGKTALLEAIRLATGAAPQFVPWLNQFRSLPMLPATGPAAFNAIWDHLFRGGNTRKPIVLRYTDSKGSYYSVRIYFDFRSVTDITQQPEGASSGASVLTPTYPIVFEREGSHIPKHHVSARVIGGNIQQETASEFGPTTAFFPATAAYNPQDNAVWFSQTSLNKGDTEILEILKREFPYLTGLAILSPAGVPALYASTTPDGQKLPLTLISAGIHKFLSLVLATVQANDGVLLVDEIDNGLYFDRLPALWTVMHRLCTQHRAQLFASTHSLECLQAALPIMKEDPEAFALIKTDQRAGICATKIVSGADAAAAIEQGIELR